MKLKTGIIAGSFVGMAMTGLLATMTASASAAVANTGPAFSITKCSREYPVDHFSDCLTVTGRGNYVKVATARYTVSDPNAGFLGEWSFTGFAVTYSSPVREIKPRYGPTVNWKGYIWSGSKHYTLVDNIYRNVPKKTWICSTLYQVDGKKTDARRTACVQILS
jgi:hypothetical protein